MLLFEFVNIILYLGVPPMEDLGRAFRSKSSPR